MHNGAACRSIFSSLCKELDIPQKQVRSFKRFCPDESETRVSGKNSQKKGFTFYRVYLCDENTGEYTACCTHQAKTDALYFSYF